MQNATDHARCVAARLTGDAKTYDGQPWFWSDQGDDKLQIAGLTTGYDRVVVRGDPAQKAFSAFCYSGDKLVGIESVNRAGDHMFGRRFSAAWRARLHAGAGGGSGFRSEGARWPRSARPSTSAAVGIDGAAPIRCTQIEAAALA